MKGPPLFSELPCFNKATLSTLIDKKGEGLNYWIKRLLSLGVVIPLKNGFFVSQDFLTKISGQAALRDRYVEYLSSVMRQPSYLSLEYCLSKQGLIPEMPRSITAITVKSPRRFSNALGSFVYRNIKEILFTGYREETFLDKSYYCATPAKALFDFIYLTRFDTRSFERQLEETLRINWDFLDKKSLKELEKYVQLSGKRKMEKFLEIIVKRGLI